MPDVEMAVNIALLPDGANPWSEKFAPWKAVTRNNSTTSAMTPSFHQTSTLLIWVKNFTPTALITQKSARRPSAVTMPTGVSVCTGSPSTMCLSVKWYHFVAYWSTPVVSMAGTTAAATQVIQPIEKLANPPKAYCGNRMTPPVTGNIVPSSEKERPMSMIITPAMAQEKTADGPAMMLAFIAPNNHPEPMIDPTPANSRPIRPMSRRRCRTSPPGPDRRGPWPSMFVVDMGELSFHTQASAIRHGPPTRR